MLYKSHNSTEVLNSTEESILQNLWQLKSYDEDFAMEIAKILDLSDPVAKLISTRIFSQKEISDYINPKIKNLLPDPFKLKDMHKAVDRLINAIEIKDKIYILADYDVDGATSSALLKNILAELKINTKIYIPQRKEGYGPNIDALNQIKKEANLLITLDCGSSAFKEFEHADQIGLDIIVLDHHITSNSLPKVVALVNPNRFDENSIYQNLAAVGVTFLFLVALISKLKDKNFFETNNIPIPNLVNYLDIVALGTICDVVKLDLLNRAFVKQGLKLTSQSKNIGYKTLCEISLVNKKNINSYDLSFLLGPQINAGGRIGNASTGSKLLSSQTYNEALTYANELNLLNIKRRELEAALLEKAMLQANLQKDSPFILIKGINWHKGLIGIIAARVKEKYSKLAIVISIENNLGTASCRSVKQIDISQKVLEAQAKNLILKGGGHKMAAGFSIDENKIDAFYNFLQNSLLNDPNATKKEIRFYDLSLRINAITHKLLNEIHNLEPFGTGNPKPIFKITDFKIIQKKILQNSHILLKIKDINNNNQDIIDAIAFKALETPVSQILSQNTSSINFAILGYIKNNIWNHKSYIQIQIQDILLK